jgi:hypothetical protein
MSFWSRREVRIAREAAGSSRAQTEPIAALVAVLAIAIGLGLYAGVAADQRVEEDGTDAEATMQRVSAGLLEDGVFADPGDRSLQPERFARPGERVRIELRWNGRLWTIGRRAPPGADAAWRPVTVQTADRRVPGRMVVLVWEA